MGKAGFPAWQSSVGHTIRSEAEPGNKERYLGGQQRKGEIRVKWELPDLSTEASKSEGGAGVAATEGKQGEGGAGGLEA